MAMSEKCLKQKSLGENHSKETKDKYLLDKIIGSIRDGGGMKEVVELLSSSEQFLQRLKSFKSPEEAYAGSDYQYNPGQSYIGYVYKCSQCEYGCYTESELTYHSKRHIDPLFCTVCNVRCKSARALDYHYHLHYPKDLASFDCKKCEYKASCQMLLDYHSEAIHRRLYKFSCLDCGLQADFDNESILVHAKLHSCYKGFDSDMVDNDEKAPAALANTEKIKSKGKSRKTLKAKASSSSAASSAKRTQSSGKDAVLDEDSRSADILGDRNEADSAKPRSVSVYEKKSVSLNDKTPWWDTGNQLNLVMPLGSATSGNPAGDTQCSMCGEFYSSALTRHQCAVVRTNLGTNPYKDSCSLCGITITKAHTAEKRGSTVRTRQSADSRGKSVATEDDPHEEVIQHYLDHHTRTWQALYMKLKCQDKIPNSQHLTHVLETLIPERYKSTADNIRVHEISDTDFNPQVNESNNQQQHTYTLHRCVKCASSFSSFDMYAGHKVLDQCHQNTNTKQQLQSNFSCLSCQRLMSSSEELINHHLQCHSEVISASNSASGSSGPTSIQSANSSTPQITEDAILMLDALQRVGEDAQEPTSSMNTQAMSNTGETNSFCAVAFDRSTALPLGSVRCSMCGYVGDRMESYTNHILTEHKLSGVPTNQPQPQPNFPPDTANKYIVLEAVMTTYHGCCFCDYLCQDKTTLTSHLSTHLNKRPANTSLDKKAEDCEGTTTDIVTVPTVTNQLKVHSLRDEAVHMRSDMETDLEIDTSKQEGNQFLCSQCGMTFLNEDDLSKHKKKVHREKKLSCDQCDFKTSHHSSLTIHIRSHTGYRPFMCGMCGKGFIANSELRKHERRHAGLVERKYKCDVCSKTYATPQHLKVHMRRHTGDRPFKCHQCNFSATSKSVLVNHYATHTGEKNYRCHLCDFQCASSGTLSNHRRLKHNIVNKRKTLAETTPESILLAAAVAGKARRVGGSKTSSSTEPQQNSSYPKLINSSLSQPIISLQAHQQHHVVHAAGVSGDQVSGSLQAVNITPATMSTAVPNGTDSMSIQLLPAYQISNVHSNKQVLLATSLSQDPPSYHILQPITVQQHQVVHSSHPVGIAHQQSHEPSNAPGP